LLLPYESEKMGSNGKQQLDDDANRKIAEQGHGAARLAARSGHSLGGTPVGVNQFIMSSSRAFLIDSAAIRIARKSLKAKEGALV